MIPPTNINTILRKKIAVKTIEQEKARILKDAIFVDDNGNTIQKAKILDAI